MKTRLTIGDLRNILALIPTDADFCEVAIWNPIDESAGTSYLAPFMPTVIKSDAMVCFPICDTEKE